MLEVCPRDWRETGSENFPLFLLYERGFAFVFVKRGKVYFPLLPRSIFRKIYTVWIILNTFLRDIVYSFMHIYFLIIFKYCMKVLNILCRLKYRRIFFSMGKNGLRKTGRKFHYTKCTLVNSKMSKTQYFRAAKTHPTFYHKISI